MSEQLANETPSVPTERADALAEAVRELKVPNQTTVVEQRTLWLAVALVAVGAVAILLGWWGASGTKYVYVEIPYVISGGIFGVALIAAGAVLFARWSLAGLFRFWLARTLADQQQQTERLVAAIESLEAAVRTNTAVTARIADPQGAQAGGRLRGRNK